jgi:DnaD/phage-associated family protein
MADYWMKLYIEILDDPKMAVLPDRLWRRTIELFLVAKKLHSDGRLPETRQIAWLLRMNTDDLDADMSQIVTTGIIVRDGSGWFIPKFAARQSAVGDAERQQQKRKRMQADQYHGNVTNESRNVTQSTEYRVQSTETESETDTEAETERAAVGLATSPELGALVRAYENDFGMLTPRLRDVLVDDLEQYGLQMCFDAMTEALKNNVRKWAYVQGILKRWHTDGRGARTNGKSHAPPGSGIAYFDVGTERQFYQDGKLIRTEVLSES